MRAPEMYVCKLCLCCILAVFLHVEGRVGRGEWGLGLGQSSSRRDQGVRGGEMRGKNAGGNLFVDECERKKRYPLAWGRERRRW